MIVYQHFSAEACGKTWVINLKKSLKLQLWAQSRLPTMTQNWKFHLEIIGANQEGFCLVSQVDIYGLRCVFSSIKFIYQINYLLNYSWNLQKVCKCFDRRKMLGKTNGNTFFLFDLTFEMSTPGHWLVHFFRSGKNSHEPNSQHWSH